MQADLFECNVPYYAPNTLPYAKGRETSKAGAKHAKPSAGTQCHTILIALKEFGSQTASELRDRTDIKQASTMSARLNSLMKAGKIYDSSERRESNCGVKTIVWKII